ncbi:MAG: hypothetical protein FRX49_07151 [Trebouxia sp. A1-2]|nr:MAG: hypothetical protein FRX49_07151 [Trebouxia sp. A1-2]
MPNVPQTMVTGAQRNGKRNQAPVLIVTIVDAPLPIMQDTSPHHAGISLVHARTSPIMQGPVPIMQATVPIMQAQVAVVIMQKAHAGHTANVNIKFEQYQTKTSNMSTTSRQVTCISGMTTWPPKANMIVPRELKVPKEEDRKGAARGFDRNSIKWSYPWPNNPLQFNEKNAPLVAIGKGSKPESSKDSGTSTRAS